MTQHIDLIATEAMVCPACGGISFTLANGDIVEVHLEDHMERIMLAHALIAHEWLSDDDDDGEDEPEPETPPVPMRELVLVD